MFRKQTNNKLIPQLMFDTPKPFAENYPYDRYTVLLQELHIQLLQELAVGEANSTQLYAKICGRLKQQDLGSIRVIQYDTDAQGFTEMETTQALYRPINNPLLVAELHTLLIYYQNAPNWIPYEEYPALFYSYHSVDRAHISIVSVDTLRFVLIYYPGDRFVLTNQHLQQLRTLVSQIAHLGIKLSAHAETLPAPYMQSSALTTTKAEPNLLQEWANTENQSYVLKLLFNSTTHFILVLDAGLTIQWFNPNAESFWQKEYKVQLQSGDTFSRHLKLWEEHNTETFLTHFQACLDSQQRQVFSLGIFSVQRGMCWYECTLNILFDDTKQSFIGISCIFRDITEKRTAERLLAEGRLQLDSIINYATEGIISIDDSEHIIVFNNAAEKIFQYAPGNTIYRGLKEFEDQIITFLKQVAVIQQSEPHKDLHRLQTYRADGELIEIEASYSMVNVGNLSLRTVIFRDITHEVALLSTLAKTEEIIKVAKWGGSIDVWEIDFTKQKVRYSYEWGMLLGLESRNAEIDLTDWLHLVHHEDVERVQEVFSKSRVASHFQIEYRICNFKNEWVWFLNSGTMIERAEDGTPIRAIGVHININDRKTREQEAKRRQQALLSAVVEGQESERRRLSLELHDGVGQKATAAKLCVSYLIEKAIKTESLVLVEDLVDLESQLNGVVNEIRTVSHDLLPPEIEERGLEAALRSFAEKCSQRAGILVRLDYTNIDNTILPHSTAATVYRLIQEAVVNGLKHAQANLIHIEVIFEHGQAYIQIDDDGIGFEVETVKKKKGIGLQNMEARTKFLNGKIQIDSAPDMGTNILVEFPLS